MIVSVAGVSFEAFAATAADAVHLAGCFQRSVETKASLYKLVLRSTKLCALPLEAASLTRKDAARTLWVQRPNDVASVAQMLMMIGKCHRVASPT